MNLYYAHGTIIGEVDPGARTLCVYDVERNTRITLKLNSKGLLHGDEAITGTGDPFSFEVNYKRGEMRDISQRGCERPVMLERIAYITEGRVKDILLALRQATSLPIFVE